MKQIKEKRPVIKTMFVDYGGLTKLDVVAETEKSVTHQIVCRDGSIIERRIMTNANPCFDTERECIENMAKAEEIKAEGYRQLAESHEKSAAKYREQIAEIDRKANG